MGVISRGLLSGGNYPRGNCSVTNKKMQCHPNRTGRIIVTFGVRARIAVKHKKKKN